MDASYFAYYESPIGLIEIGGTAQEVLSLYFVDGPRARPYDCRVDPVSHATVEEVARQVADYFDGTRREFHLDIAFHGTSFQELVWRQLLAVPYGRVATYGEIADAIGRPKAVRAVGAAVGRNLISIVVPCHRIIGSDGTLTGYGGGLWRKEWLLRHEGYLLV